MAEVSEDKLQSEIQVIVKEQQEIAKRELELTTMNPEFKAFMDQKKEIDEKAAAVWNRIEEAMLENNIKSIKGDWGYVTIAERTNFKVNLDLLPAKFIKKVPDTTKIGAAYKLENKPPKGVEIEIKKYLTKKIK